MQSLVLSFDIGIHNLAFCCLEQTEAGFTVKAWDNVSLLTDSSNVTDVKETCAECKAKPKFTAAGRKVCGRHVPIAQQPLKDSSGTILTKLPSVQVLKDAVKKHIGANEKIPAKKEDLVNLAAKFYALPYKSEGAKKKASQASIATLHDGLRTLVQKHKDLWSKCTLICLENQPAFKNPQMKSVQMLLFATLRDIMQPSPPPIQLVHAGLKVQGKKKGDEGYKERKKGSEDRAVEFLSKGKCLNTAEAKKIYDLAKKKNDLADALCMSIDHSFKADA